MLDDLIRRGELRAEVVDGVDYVEPANAGPVAPPLEVVRLLAPFDPLVWDRRRFEHLWGWSYRFEAYTPVAKRTRGYYAMPLLWRDRVIGWANARLVGGRLEVEPGYVKDPPRERAFRRELAAEVARLEAFLAAP